MRYFNSYGPRLDPKGYGSVIAKFVTQARLGQPMTVFADGSQTRASHTSDDTVRGTILAGTLPEAIGRVFNIGSNRETKIVELAKMIRKLLGSDSEIVHVPYRNVFGENFEETRRRVPDIRRAQEVWAFGPRHRWKKGSRNTIDWFRQAWPRERLDPGRNDLAGFFDPVGLRCLRMILIGSVRSCGR